MSNRSLAAVAIGAAVLMIACTLALGDALAHASTRTACGAEDSAAWVWSRCGNHKRGVVDLRTGRRVVVGPCAFRRLWLHGNADLSRPADRMRGDWLAIHTGCR